MVRAVRSPELVALDRELGRPGSKMTMETYHARHAEIREKERHERELRKATPAPAVPAQTSARTTSARWKVPEVSADKLAEIEAAGHVFKKALAAGNLELARSTMASEPFSALLSHEAHKNAAKITAPYAAGALYLLFHTQEVIKSNFAYRQVQVEALEARIAALEERPAMKYAGVWREGVGYEPGAVATYDGSMFHCDKATTTRPGTSADWTLCVKHGRDLR